MKLKRIYGLDYLRGLSAISISIYHLLLWNAKINSPSSFLAKFGIYGVSLFFILSGYALTHVSLANGLTLNKKPLIQFYKKRFIRIYPLYWFVLIITLLVTNKNFDFTTIILNILGIFSLFKPAAYISGGSWSIGIELVFYMFFPFLFKAIQGNLSLLFSVVCSIFLFLFGAFYFNNSQNNFSELWLNYVNPINHIIFFLFGMICRHFEFRLNGGLSWIWLLSSLFLIYIYPIETKDNLIVGFDRIVLSSMACLLMIPFINLQLKSKYTLVFHKLMIFLGDVSYSLYLLHPIVYAIIKKFFQIGHIEIGISYFFTCIFFSLITSFFSYHFVEKKGQLLLNWFLLKLNARNQ